MPDINGTPGNDTLTPGLGNDIYVCGEDGDDLLVLDFSVTDTGFGVSGYGGSSGYFQRPDSSGNYIDYISHSDFERRHLHRNQHRHPRPCRCLRPLWHPRRCLKGVTATTR